MNGPVLRATLLRVLVVLVCAGLLAPIAIVAILSFSGDPYLQFPPRSLSLHWYQRFMGDARWRGAVLNSAVIAAMTCVLSTALGFLAAYAMARGALFGKRAWAALLLMPLIVPHVVTAVAHSVVALPVVLVILQSALETVDPNLERAAMVCGCTRFGVFRRVVVPLALPAVVSAAPFSFLTSFDEVVISLFPAGVRFETLPVRIWNSLMLKIEPTIAAVSTLLIALTTLALTLDWPVRWLRDRGVRAG